MPRIEKPNISEQKVLNVKNLQKMAKAVLENKDRLRMIRLIANAPQSFLEIEKKLNLSSSTTYLHLKELTKEAIIFRSEEGKYCITMFGKHLLNHWAQFKKRKQIIR